jgi:hypothetical protein
VIYDNPSSIKVGVKCERGESLDKPRDIEEEFDEEDCREGEAEDEKGRDWELIVTHPERLETSSSITLR